MKKSRKKPAIWLAVIIIILAVCIVKNKSEKIAGSYEPIDIQVTEENSTSTASEESETEITENQTEGETTSEVSEISIIPEDLIRPDFKEMMDSYEEFFDEYIAFMEKYSNADSSDSMSMMNDYFDYMTKYSEVMEKLGAVDQSELSDAETLYYIEFTTRISQKMMGAVN